MSSSPRRHLVTGDPVADSCGDRPVTSAGDDLDRLDSAFGSLVDRNRPFGALSTYRVGGSAALFAEPAGEEELLAVAKIVAAVVSTSAPPGAPPLVLALGKGSNLLVADNGFPGLVVSLNGGFDEIAIEGQAQSSSPLGLSVRAGAGVSLPVLARRTAAAGLTGLEWAVGVPGSVGGAIRMNAGGHGSDRRPRPHQLPGRRSARR